jgi:hypothetical protein
VLLRHLEPESLAFKLFFNKGFQHHDNHLELFQFILRGCFHDIVFELFSEILDLYQVFLDQVGEVGRVVWGFNRNSVFLLDPLFVLFDAVQLKCVGKDKLIFLWLEV